MFCGWRFDVFIIVQRIRRTKENHAKYFKTQKKDKNHTKKKIFEKKIGFFPLRRMNDYIVIVFRDYGTTSVHLILDIVPLCNILACTNE